MKGFFSRPAGRVRAMALLTALMMMVTALSGCSGGEEAAKESAVILGFSSWAARAAGASAILATSWRRPTGRASG